MPGSKKNSKKSSKNILKKLSQDGGRKRKGSKKRRKSSKKRSSRKGSKRRVGRPRKRSSQKKKVSKKRKRRSKTQKGGCGCTRDQQKGGCGCDGSINMDELLKDVDTTKPVIVMDHQPTTLDESVQNNVDLHLSGHTHNGQIWPLNLLIRKIYQLSWGYEKRGTTHIYVSSGFGTWGPPVRIGSHPEIVELILSFE